MGKCIDCKYCHPRKYSTILSIDGKAIDAIWCTYAEGWSLPAMRRDCFEPGCKPINCLICGSIPDIHHRKRGSYRVRCHDLSCGTSGPIKGSKDESITAWNKLNRIEE